MFNEDFFKVIHLAEKLKNETRHSWTSNGRHESVAEHSYRMALMILLLKDEVKDIDMQRVLELSLVHDLGEAILGDIPVFNKASTDEDVEKDTMINWLNDLSHPLKDRLIDLVSEVYECKTKEAMFMKAIDQLEAVDQHNLADLSTWLENEYTLQLTHGEHYASMFEITKSLRKDINQMSIDKMEEGKNESSIS